MAWNNQATFGGLVLLAGFPWTGSGRTKRRFRRIG